MGIITKVSAACPNGGARLTIIGLSMLQQVIHCACSFADPLIKVLMMRYCMLICFDVLHDLCQMSVAVILLHIGGLTAGYASAHPSWLLHMCLRRRIIHLSSLSGPGLQVVTKEQPIRSMRRKPKASQTQQ